MDEKIEQWKKEFELKGFETCRLPRWFPYD